MRARPPRGKRRCRSGSKGSRFHSSFASFIVFQLVPPASTDSQMVKVPRAARLLAAMMLAVGEPASSAAQCRTNADTASIYRLTINGIFSNADSASLAAHGYPFARPSAVSLITNSATCAAAITAYNAAANTSGTPDSIASAYVFGLGSTGWVVVNPADKAGDYLLYHIFNAGWILKESLGG